jgi:phosphopantothenoylcysteine decarboxylase / phosphopantothenate---cysteine ligase
MNGKKILIGVTASIAAYKIASLVRLLVKAGAEVQVIMTKDSQEFITPLTLSTLSKKPVYSDFIKNDQGEWTNHVDLGLWADVFLVAPASANTIAKMANGICDNLLLAVYLSAKCPVFVAPAMDLDMYLHPSTKNNLASLKNYGNTIISARHGELASGLVGEGRMAEPEELFDELQNFFSKKKDLTNKKVMITAGPTYESIDPVRFIGNHSSGKMGLALAIECFERGADVHLICGPNQLNLQNYPFNCIEIRSSQEMYEACISLFEQMDVAIMSAAVADYKVKDIASQKIKKKDDSIQLELTKTIDILSSLGKQKKKQILVGFALETENETANAADKLKRKNADMIVLNSLNDNGAGFGHDTNKISILHKDERIQQFGLKSKKEVAMDIINEIVSLLNFKN